MAGHGEEEPPTTGKVGGDKLILRGLQFHGFHGVKQEEKKLGQKFVIDVDAWMDLAAAGDSDDISHTVSYSDIYRCSTPPPPRLSLIMVLYKFSPPCHCSSIDLLGVAVQLAHHPFRIRECCHAYVHSDSLPNVSIAMHLRTNSAVGTLDL